MKRNILFLALILICGSISAQNHYTFNTHSYKFNMAITAQIKINDVEQTSNDIELGAFNGESIRGSQRIGQYGSAGYYRALIQIYDNPDETNYEVTFKIYNHDTGEELDNYDVTYQGEPYVVRWVASDAVGSNKHPVVLNFATTFTKPITAYTPNSKDHYYLIASPLNVAVSPDDVTNMTSNNFDLYYFDQGQEKEWINYKGNNGDFDLEPGKGYLYANSQTIDLIFAGAPYNGDGQVSLVKDLNGNNGNSGGFLGWNLVGNPFPQTAYIDRSFYRMNEGGTELESSTGAINDMEGIFVIANENGETLTFNTEAPAKGGEQLVVNLTQNRGTSIDRAIVGFNEGDVLPKFMLNENNTKLYIPQGNKDYAVVRSAGQGVLPLNFRAAKNGTYTLNIDTENVEMNYLHLIDNMTGMDVDLLQNPSYTFEATTRDYESRFKLVFASASTDSVIDAFAFFSNGNWIINNDGKATLQIVDVNGHILCNEQINGSCSKSFEAAPGIYMLRLINGDNVKVQKVVIK